MHSTNPSDLAAVINAQDTTFGLRRITPCRMGGRAPLQLVAPFGVSSANEKPPAQAVLLDYIAEGANMIQELSTYGCFWEQRAGLSADLPVPFGTVFAYEVFARAYRNGSTAPGVLKECIQASIDSLISAKVDYTTLHLSINRQRLTTNSDSFRNRAISVPSRAGAMMIQLMKKFDCENPLIEYQDIIFAALQANQIGVSLGGSFRSASVVDALDALHRIEIEDNVFFERKLRANGIPVMFEGVSHIPLDSLRTYVDLFRGLGATSPVTALGPLLTDRAAGYDHIAGAIGAALAYQSGFALVNIITQAEHLSMPQAGDVIESLRAFRVARYCTSLTRNTETWQTEREFSVAREGRNWERQSELALFPSAFENLGLKNGQPCEMCGTRCPLPTSANTKAS